MQFEIDGVKLFYEVRGNQNSDVAIAFFNGVMATTNSWYGMLDGFEKLGFKIVLHDFMGQMKSDKPQRSMYSFEEHCRQAKALLDSLNVKKVHIVGTSYGGETGMKFALKYPEFVASLSIIDSVSEVDEISRCFVSSWKTLADSGDGEKFFWGMAPSIYGGKFIAENKQMLEKRAQACKLIGKDYYEGQKILYDTFCNDLDFTSELKNIVCPTLIICGENDILKPPAMSLLMHRNIENSEYVVLPECGHVAIFEKPKELVSVILGFIFKNS